MIVHPAYDPAKGEWFIDKHAAPTLRELLKQLPANTVIADYYPKGYKHVIVYREAPLLASGGPRIQSNEDFTSHKKLFDEERVSRPHIKRLKPKRYPGLPHHCKYDRERILNLWVTGKTGPEIARELGIKRWVKINQVVAQARHHGDPRAISRASVNWRYKGREIRRIEPRGPNGRKW